MFFHLSVDIPGQIVYNGIKGLMNLKNAILNLFKTLFFFDTAVVAVFFLPYKEKSNAASTALSRETVFLGVVAVLTLFFWLLIERRKVRIFCFKQIFRHYSVGLLCGIIPIAATVAFLWVTRHLHFGGRTDTSHILIWLAALFVNTLATELLFRGYLFRLYRTHYAFPIAALLVSALFFSMNYPILSVGKTYVLNLLLLNIILCFLADETGSFLAPLVGHFVYRLISTLALGSLPVAGAYPQLFYTSVSGSSRFTGGEKGLEGSLVLLICQLGLIAWFTYKRMKGKKIKLPDFVWKFIRFIDRKMEKKKQKKASV